MATPIVDFAERDSHNRFMLIERIAASIKREGMIDPGDHVLVAVSGGIDSVVLLDALTRLASDWPFTLTIAHLDHGLRASSAEDAQFVRDLGAALNIPVIVERADASSYEAHHGLGREGAAREVRHAFLNRAADQAKATRIALGHTATDRAETILFRLTRGTGPDGLAGIRPTRDILVRPMIDVSREDVVHYAKDRGLSWREDLSNQDPAFSRNRIRHRVLGELEQINPHASAAICRAGDLIVELSAVAELWVKQTWPSVLCREAPGEVALHRAAVTAQSPEVQSLLLREAIQRTRGSLNGIDRGHISKMLSLLASDSAHAQVDLPGLVARMQGDQILLTSGLPEVVELSTPIDLGRSTLPDLGCMIDLRIVDRGEASAQPPGTAADRRTETADADCIHFPLHIRTRRPGDRFAPLGMGQQVKLKDFLMNQRIPYYDRNRIPLLCDRKRIIWAVGTRLAHEVRITETTKRLLIMRVEES